MSTLGERLRRSRKNMCGKLGVRKVSMDDIAKILSDKLELKIRGNTYGQWERNLANPSLNMTIVLAEVFDVDFTWLATGKYANRKPIGDRLIYARKSKSEKISTKVNHKNVSDYIGISEKEYSDYELNNFIPSLDKIELIAEFLSVDSVWLATGHIVNENNIDNLLFNKCLEAVRVVATKENIEVAPDKINIIAQRLSRMIESNSDFSTIFNPIFIKGNIIENI